MANKPLHFNIPQVRSMLVDANKTYLVWARGTGKSSGAMSPKLLKVTQEMPRSQIGIVGATFQQILVRTLPTVIANWERMGYRQGFHFIVGESPYGRAYEKWRRMWKWDGPLVKPLDHKYAIYWYNGAVMMLISQDRVGSSNGLSLQFIAGDEAKLLNKERLDDEVMPTLRGFRHIFGKESSYRGEFFSTDMPTTAKSSWILDKADLMNEEQIRLIMHVQLQVNIIQKEVKALKGSQAEERLKRLAQFEKALLKLRRGSIYYSEASALDNIDVLGDDYIKDMKRSLSESKFNASILNQRLKKIDGGFYGVLDPDIHGADWFNYSYLDNYIGRSGVDEIRRQDCRHDNFDLNRPLDIAMDYGADINCLVACQHIGNEYRALNSFYALHPALVDVVVQQFCQYYQYAKTKVVNYFYDHTAVGKHGLSEFTYSGKVVETLRSHGWTVNEYYVGQAPSHDRKYELINTILREEDHQLPVFRYSKTNCEQLEVSMANAGLRKGSKGFEKDKTPERDPSVAPQDATHLSDAIDTLLYFRFLEYFESQGAGIGASMR